VARQSIFRRRCHLLITANPLGMTLSIGPLVIESDDCRLEKVPKKARALLACLAASCGSRLVARIASQCAARCAAIDHNNETPIASTEPSMTQLLLNQIRSTGKTALGQIARSYRLL
jgi:hypothetical protein